MTYAHDCPTALSLSRKCRILPQTPVSSMLCRMNSCSSLLLPVPTATGCVLLTRFANRTADPKLLEPEKFRKHAKNIEILAKVVIINLCKGCHHNFEIMLYPMAFSGGLVAALCDLESTGFPNSKGLSTELCPEWDCRHRGKGPEWGWSNNGCGYQKGRLDNGKVTWKA